MYADWLDKFYADDKYLDYPRAMRGGYPISQFNTLIQMAGNNCLPCFVPSARSGRTVFYALAQDARSLDELRRILTAALGSADTNADVRVIYSSEEPGEQLLLERSPGGILTFHFLPVLNGSREEINERREERKIRVYSMLVTILELYDQRPRMNTLAKRQTGRILRDFYTACQARDGDCAAQYLEELRGNQALSPLNLIFLELLVMAASAKWEAILSHSKLDMLLNGRMPERIQRLLLRASGHSLMNAIQQEDFPEDKRDAARRLALDLMPLYKLKPRFTQHERFLPDWQLWAMGAALLGINEWQTASPLLSAEWMHTLEQWATGSTKLSPTLGKVEGALIQAPVVALISIDDATELLQETLLADVEREIEIYARLAAMPEATQQALQKIPKRWDAWLSLKKRCELQGYGWNSWLNEAAHATEAEQIESLRQLASAHYLEWGPVSFEEQQWLSLLGQQVQPLLGKALRDGLPTFLNWLEEYDVQVSSILWLDWLMLLAMDDLLSEEDVRLGGMILDKFLSSAFVSADYASALEAMEMICLKNTSLRAMGYGLDIAESLHDMVVGDEGCRLGFWIKIQRMLKDRWERLDNGIQLSACMVERLYLGDDAGHYFPVETSEPGVASPLHRDLTGKTLVIYSLTESAAQRGKDTLIQLYPGLSIELNHDHVSTTALINRANSADYFIFASKSAKHQAFDAVTGCRKDIIYPSGKGASSMVTAFIQALG
ncbi:protein DpdD [Serratia fonticola]|uniref:protein DpdD n=1 Tax=Serratia fonticola TaxID=47917 RepID=UPI0034C63451